jgi:biotin carboxyl carrier protein
MRKFVINVNGNQYEVEVEEVGGGSQTVAYTAPVAPAAPATPKPVADAPATSSAPAGSIKVTSPMPGTILDIRVSPGQAVKKGDVLLILEAMKMENEIVAPQDGTIASINTTKGSSVNSGDLLASING